MTGLADRHQPAPTADSRPAIDVALTDLVDGQRRRDRAAERRQARERVRVDEDSATFADVLRDLAEAGHAVRVTACGGAVTGQVAWIGADHVVVDTPHARCFLPLGSVDTVAPLQVGSSLPTPRHRGDQVAMGRTMHGVLRDLAERGASVSVHLRHGSELVVGTARTCGEDVMTVVPNRPAGQPTFVQWANVQRIDERR